MILFSTIDPRSLTCKSCPSFSKGTIKPFGWFPVNNGVPGANPEFNNCNLPPTSHVPTICHLDSLSRSGVSLDFSLHKNEMNENPLVGVPMYWSFIPRFYKNSLKTFPYTTNNCRSDSILDKRMFSHALHNGQRCIILADAYYEWHTTKSTGVSPSKVVKQPFIIYNPENKGFWNSSVPEEHAPLLIAGLFENNPIVNEPYPLVSTTVITVDATHTPTGYIHHRMPAVLSVEDALKWLNPHTPVDEALTLLIPNSDLTFQPVSTKVNAVRNKSVDVCFPLNEIPMKVEKTQKSLDSWLTKTPSPKKENQIESPPSAKKIKIEKEEAEESGVKIENDI